MKRDGRTLDHQTLETIRLMAIERVREGERPSEVIEAYGFNRTTIYKWINTAFGSRAGISALRSTKATGRPRSLTPAQERQYLAGSMGAIRASTVWTLACGRAAWWLS